MHHYPFQSIPPPQLPLELRTQTCCYARILPRTDHSLSLLPLQFLLACLPSHALVQAHPWPPVGLILSTKFTEPSLCARPIEDLRNEIDKVLEELDKQLTRNK